MKTDIEYNYNYLNEALKGQVLPVFYSDNYIKLENSRGHSVLFFNTKDNSIALVARTFKIKFLRYLQFIFPPLRKGSLLPEHDESIFMKAVIKIISERDLADRISQPENFCIFSSVPKNSIACGFGSYKLALSDKSVHDLWTGLHVKHRNVIKTAEQKSVTAIFGRNQLSDFYELYTQTMKRNGMYLEPFSFFEQLYDHMPENLICGVSYHDNKPQGALLVPYNKFCAFYVYGASSQKVEVTGAVNYLHWELIKILKNLNVNDYDLVGARLSDISGSRYEGIQRFKERFGAKLYKGYIWKMDIKKPKCAFFDLLLNLKIKLKGSKINLDIIEQERLKAN